MEKNIKLERSGRGRKREEEVRGRGRKREEEGREGEAISNLSLPLISSS